MRSTSMITGDALVDRSLLADAGNFEPAGRTAIGRDEPKKESILGWFWERRTLLLFGPPLLFGPVLAPGDDDGRLEDIIIQSVMSSNRPLCPSESELGDVEAAASLLVCGSMPVERRSCRIHTIRSLRSPRHDPLFSLI